MITCPHCTQRNPIGSVLCAGCNQPLPDGMMTTIQPRQDPSTHRESGTAGTAPRAITPVSAKFVIIGLNGAAIPEAANLAIPIPMDLLRSEHPVRIGRRAWPQPDQPPEMDFGPFLWGRTGPPYPVSRKAALLHADAGGITLRRIGHAPIYTEDATGMNRLIADGDRVPITEGTLLSFGYHHDHIRVVVRLGS